MNPDDELPPKVASLSMNMRRYRSRILPQDALDVSCPQIKQDILRMITQYLHNESYFTSVVVLQDEANMKTSEQQNRRAQSKRLRKAILEGDWELTSNLTKNLPRLHHKRYLYVLYKQEYLELVEKQEYQKAFAYLNRKLKPMEHTIMSNPVEFQHLCYLLTCKSVSDSPHFSGWEGIMAGREKLADDLSKLLEVENSVCMYDVSSDTRQQEIPPNRLVSLLQQAVAYQMEFKRYHPLIVPEIKSLARDYQFPVVPNVLRDVFVGQSSGVKAVEWCGEDGFLIAAGGNDFGISIWSSNPGKLPAYTESVDDSYADDMLGMSQKEVESSNLKFIQTDESLGFDYQCNPEESIEMDAINFDRIKSAADSEGVDTGYGRTSTPLFWLKGHTNKIWDIASNKDGSRLASASGDSSIKIWALPSNASLSRNTYDGSPVVGLSQCSLSGHDSDVYSVQFHPDQSHLVSGGHDRSVRLYDVCAEKEVKVFTGHDAGVLQATTNVHGNLLVSGSRDGTIKFWDVMSGVSIKSFNQPSGAVTSVQVSSDGRYLLSSSRHGSVRLWDMRLDDKPLLRYRGHSNTSSSFLKATFGADDSLVLGGSNCGDLHVWDRKTGTLVQRLKGHSGAVYRGVWNEKQSMAVSCGDDGTVRTWWWHEP